MYHILVAVDDTVSHAKAQAKAIRRLAEGTGDLSVTVLHVFTENVAGASVQQLETARKVQDLLSEAGVDVTFDETSGEPGVEILKYAEEHIVDQICVGGHKRSPTGKALFGSVTQDVVLGTTRPVMVCGSSES